MWKNAFNEAMRRFTLNRIWEDDNMRYTRYYFWRTKIPISYVGLGGGPAMVRAPFNYEEGEQQGALESIPLFTFSRDTANNATNDELRPRGGALVAGTDGTYLIAPSPPKLLFYA